MQSSELYQAMRPNRPPVAVKETNVASMEFNMTISAMRRCCSPPGFGAKLGFGADLGFRGGRATDVVTTLNAPWSHAGDVLKRSRFVALPSKQSV